MKKITKKQYKYFDDIKHIDENGKEFWYARELAEVLDYNKWENFAKVIKRAMIACENSGHSIEDQFPEIRKLIEHGKGGKQMGNKRRHIMQTIDNVDMNVDVDWNTAVRNPYINKFTREEKIKAILDCIIAVEKVSKEELKKEVDAILA